MKQKTAILLIFLAVLLCAVGPGFYNGLKVVRYTIGGSFGSGNIRIALVTDLHSCAYGEDQRELVDAIEAEAPDLLLLGGDIFDDDLPDVILEKVHELYENRQKYIDRMAESSQINSTKIIMGLIEEYSKK